MRKSMAISTGALIFIFLTIGGREKPLFPNNTSDVPKASALGSVKVNQDFGRMPLYFIPNKGQAAAQVEYYIQGKDKTVYFTPEGLTYVLNGRGAGEKKDESRYFGSRHLRTEKEENELQNMRGWVVKLNFVGANPDVRPSGEEKTEAVISYFKGRPEEWKTGLPTYSRIVYRDLWPGIDLAYFGTTDRLKYEFIVHPGAEPSQIGLSYSGVDDLKVNGEGQLEVSTPAGGFEDGVPIGYQEVDGTRVDVALRYKLEQSPIEETGAFQEGALERSYIYGFEVGEYDRTRPLILDPVVLVYCGYIGGQGNDMGYGIALDGSRNVYITGDTYSTSTKFPLTVGPDLTFNGGNIDAFVAKLDSTGTAFLYCGYIGGSGSETGYGIAVDGSGNAYITGHTDSTQATFPVLFGPDLTYNGDDSDAFVAKVNSTGTALLYCGYIGGSDIDTSYGIAVDSYGNAYVTGETESTQATFPVTVGPDLTYNTWGDVFVAKVDSMGTALLYCGYIGGLSYEESRGIAVDSSGNVYVTGYTFSTQDEDAFPVLVGPDLTQNGYRDVFVAKVNSIGTALLYCGYIGGKWEDFGYGITVDDSGNAFITGSTDGGDGTFPSLVGPDVTYNCSGGSDAFVAKVDSTGSRLLYCGFLGGGSGATYGEGIAIDGSGNAYLTGFTYAKEINFPILDGPDLTHNGRLDAFVAKVNSTGSAFVYVGYIGGSIDDRGYGIAVDGYGNVYVGGYTYSSEATFPVLIGPDLTHNGTADVFVAKVSSTNPKYTLTISAGTGGTTDPVPGNYTHDAGTQVTVTAQPNSGYKFNGWSGAVTGTTNPVTITMDGDKSITASFATITTGTDNKTEEKKSCFIATAAFGSPLHPHVKVLRDFRDKFLMASQAGRKFVSLYYRYSPAVAEIISQHEILKRSIRIFLLPAIGFSYLMVHFGTGVS